MLTSSKIVALRMDTIMAIIFFLPDMHNFGSMVWKQLSKLRATNTHWKIKSEQKTKNVSFCFWTLLVLKYFVKLKKIGFQIQLYEGEMVLFSDIGGPWKNKVWGMCSGFFLHVSQKMPRHFSVKWWALSTSLKRWLLHPARSCETLILKGWSMWRTYYH